MTAGGSFYRVSDRGHGIGVYTAPKVAPRPTRERETPDPVVVVRAAPAAAVAIALRLADGDASRLEFTEDGGVVVANRPRSERR